MTSENYLGLFGGVFGIILLVLSMVWLVMWLVVPFMIYFILHRLRRIHEDLYAKQVECNRLLAEALRAQSAVLPATRDVRLESEATRNPFAK